MLLYLNLIPEPENKSKFEQLYTKYKNPMANAAKTILKDQHLAEDCLQKAFLRIIGNLDNIKDIDSYSTKSYLITITENIAIDMYRKIKKEKEIIQEEISLKMYQEEYEIELKDEIEQALTNISIEHMTVIKLKCIHNYSTKEIATMLKTSEKTIQKRLERAKAKLKQELEKIGVSYK